MSRDPQNDRTHECSHCDGTGKCPAHRAELEQYKRENPDEDCQFTENDIEDCPECDGLGTVDPDANEEYFDEEFNDDIRHGII